MGLSVTKAVVCDLDGREMGSGEARSPCDIPRPRWVERRMPRVWADCVEAIAGAIRTSGVSGADILAIGVAGHGDGLYLVDDGGNPVRPAMLSLDSRAHGVVERWREEGVLDRALALTGKRPFAASPAAALTWMREHEPQSLESSRWVLSCKDWIKLKLTGEISTDPTEASASFTDVHTQGYSDAAFRLFDLEELREKVPPVVGCAGVAGRVTPEAAAATGLGSGTPVVSGAHDVDANALGVGSLSPGRLCIVSGTWSINEVVSTEPLPDPRWECRNFVVPGLYMHMATSPASATNLDWFVRKLCAAEIEEAGRQGLPPFEFASAEVAAVMEEKSGVFYHPFLYGSPQRSDAAGGFFGLRGWHTRAHLLRALFEGVVFNHKAHVDALRSAFPVSEVRLTGGGVRSDLWRQMFADALGVPVGLANTHESGARGAALCAGVGAGAYASVDEAVGRVVRIVRTYEPDAARHAALSEAYDTYTALIDALAPLWPRMA